MVVKPRKENDMFEIIIEVLSTIWIVINIFVAILMDIQTDDNDTKISYLNVIREFIDELFYDRNCFGILLSVAIFILLLPAIVINIVMQIIFWIGMALEYIYNLGNKKK